MSLVLLLALAALLAHQFRKLRTGHGRHYFFSSSLMSWLGSDSSVSWYFFAAT